MDRSQSQSSRSTISQPHGRDAELMERRRREWMEQQERERKHERLKRRKIEEWERKRKAEQGAKNDIRRSSRRSCSSSSDRLACSSQKLNHQARVTKPTVMSQKFESLGNNTPLFKGREGTKIDIVELRRIKVDIHRNITAAEISNELQRGIVDPEDVKLKRREGEGAKPIFEREELMKRVVTPTEVEEHRTVVALDRDKTEKKLHSTRKCSVSPTPNSRKKDGDDSRPNRSDAWTSRRESSKYTSDRSENNRSSKHDSGSKRGSSRDRSKERRESYKRDDSRDRHSPRRTVRHDVSRDHRDRHNRSNSRNRESQRTETRHRSSRETLPRRESRDRDRDDFRDTRNLDTRSRERMIPISHHYAEAVPYPLYYGGFHPRPMMMGPMMPISNPMSMGRGRMPSMMGPMRPLFPPRFVPPNMFRPALNPNHRFHRMF